MCRRRRFAFSALWMVAACAAAPASIAQGSAMIGLNSTLSAVAEVPPNKSSARGTLQATLDRTKNILRWRLEFVGLSAPATAAHFHGPAMPGENAGVVLTIDAKANSGEARLTAAQANELLDGKLYVNIHTATYPDGEIRGQVLPQK